MTASPSAARTAARLRGFVIGLGLACAAVQAFAATPATAPAAAPPASATSTPAAPPAAPSSGVRYGEPAYASRSAVHALNGAAATSNPLATGVALDVLRRGGTALDAALAANAVLAVVEPHNTGPGGDVFAIVWDPRTERLHGYNGSGRAPAGLTLAQLRDALGPDATVIPRGPYAVTVPGAVDAWFALHARFGRRPMRELLASAIAYARDGAPISFISADIWALAASRAPLNEATAARDGFRAAFLPGGRAPATGEPFRNPAFAATLQAIADDGRDAFYRGRLARELDAYARAAGSPLRAADLAAHRGEWVEPISTRYRGYDVHQLPPNTQGATTLQILNLLEGYDLRAMGFGSADHVHVMLEAFKLVYEDRARLSGDADAMRETLPRLLSKEYAAERRALIDLRSARPLAAAPSEPRQTTYVTVADRDGMMVSLISSLFHSFGTGLVPPELGFALQSRGAGFSLDAAHPNAYAPGKRPFHTIIPAFVTKDGAPWFSFGVLGGPFQPQGQAQILVNMIDFGMDAQRAGDAPRFALIGGPEPWSAQGDRPPGVRVEPALGGATLEELRRRGHDARVANGMFGGYQGIRRDPATGVYEAGSDPRWDGMAAGW